MSLYRQPAPRRRRPRWVAFGLAVFLLGAVAGGLTALSSRGAIDLALPWLGGHARAVAASPSASAAALVTPGSPGHAPSGGETMPPSPGSSASPDPSQSGTPATPGPSASSSGPPSGIDPALAARLQRALETARSKLELPGVSATIIFPDGSTWTGVSGYAVVATKQPVTAQTPFAIASVTKTFTSALILRLAEQGKLSLDDKLSRWVPTYPDASKLTIRMLLNHTSGLDDFFQDPKFDKALNKDKTYVWTPEQVLAFDPKYFDIVFAQPGTNWHYSNTNYLLLGLVAERAGGGSWASLLHQQLLDPLGLSSIIVQGVDQPTVPLAHANTMALNAKKKVVALDVSDGTAIAPFTSVTTAAFSAGALASTSGDLARWAKLLYGGDVLRAASRKQLLTFVPAARWYYSSYGLGVSKATFNGHGAYGHTGALAGTRSATRWFPKDKVAMAALFNRDGIKADGTEYRGDDVLKYLAEVLWPSPPKPGASARP